MRYDLLRLRFSTPVHFGNGRLDTAEMTFCADRLFSALCIEALKKGGEAYLQKICDAAKSGKLLFSDGLPYIGDTYYIPKPVIHIERSSGENSSVLKKAFKKLSYIPVGKTDDFFSGNIDPEAENKKFDKIGKFGKRHLVTVRNGEEDPDPYHVGEFSFNENCGLYVILASESDDLYYDISELVEALGYCGIGGKITSGMGKFTVSAKKVPEGLLRAFDGEHDRYVSLSVCMAKNEELETALKNAGYVIIKRSGFINSCTYAGSFRKKSDFYCFAAGACFEKKFEGDVFDVSQGGAHPVWRYAKPLFMGVDIP
ncbi:MAG: type III-A CRISPR-associated RAMP protein Csm4 [Ruminococcus sp.]|uniref:type III-A CRISPR-associated RAMP protein Csm4 n=1 Tax=Ruminococcus sp. TaxID=41978 RepID=UPI0025D8DACE|nr:type III-A CRISPR-associated RAMP protein Csm4 [Ruminococcus sp.]MBR0528836.1 type III-A CRISPR-associated RAMP protein Csm4 [Ruminococcus sp.]